MALLVLVSCFSHFYGWNSDTEKRYWLKTFLQPYKTAKLKSAWHHAKKRMYAGYILGLTFLGRVSKYYINSHRNECFK